jgi:2-methylisocitrate lyase-like PEP mutase family enzyme
MEAIRNEIIAAANAKSRRLRELVRAPEILVMPGAYDVLSARLFEQMGFPAIQGTSGGIAASLGYPDGEAMSREEFLDVTGDIAAAVSLPVNADAERGYGEVGATVRGLVARGVAGMNLEDGVGGHGGARGLVELPRQLEKIAAVTDAKRALGSEFFLNARVDAFMIMKDDPKKALGESIRRGNAYAEAGGDCIFFLQVHARDIIATLVKEIAAPVSILAGPESPSVAELQEIGLARVSYGSAFLKAAIGATRKLAREIRERGTVTALKEGLTTPEVAALVQKAK